MTVLVAPDALTPPRAEEHWHGATMRGGVLSSVVTTRAPGGAWSVRTRLRDRSLQPIGAGWSGDGFATEEAALRAGEAAASRMHKRLIGTRSVPAPSRTILDFEPSGGYQSQALRRLAWSLHMEQPARAASAGKGRAGESEKIA